MQALDAKWQPFVEAVESYIDANGVSIRHKYSGRGMFGKTCLGVVLTNTKMLTELYFHLGWEAFDCGNLETPVDVRIDDMGRDMIVYWPSVEVLLKEPEEDDEDGDQDRSFGRREERV